MGPWSPNCLGDLLVWLQTACLGICGANCTKIRQHSVCGDGLTHLSLDNTQLFVSLGSHITPRLSPPMQEEEGGFQQGCDGNSLAARVQ